LTGVFLLVVTNITCSVNATKNLHHLCWTFKNCKELNTKFLVWRLNFLPVKKHKRQSITK